MEIEMLHIYIIKVSLVIPIQPFQPSMKAPVSLLKMTGHVKRDIRSAVQCSAEQCTAVHCSVEQCSAVQCTHNFQLRPPLSTTLHLDGALQPGQSDHTFNGATTASSNQQFKSLSGAWWAETGSLGCEAGCRV